MSGLYRQDLNYSPARAVSPHIRPIPDESQYLAELLAERQKIQPFVQVVPICSRLLNQDISTDKGAYKVVTSRKKILRVSTMLSNHGLGDFERLHRGSPSPLSPLDRIPNLGPTALGGWNGPHPHERFGGPNGALMDWQSAPGSPSALMVKRIFRLDIPVDSFPNFNFVGRLLGPRGNSLKRVEASTGCRVFIRGRGSIKDPEKEEGLRGRPGYEHLNEQLHILVEAELPSNIVDAKLRQAQEIIEELLKPVDESQDYYKKEQLRELAMLKSNSREESPRPAGSVSPFNSSGMKRAKTVR